MDVPNIMQAKFDENEIRKQFTVSERVALADDIMEEEKAAAKERQGARSDLEHPGHLSGMSKKERPASSPPSERDWDLERPATGDWINNP